MRKRWLISSALVALTACGGGAEAPETIYFSALERDAFSPTTFGDPGPRASADEIARMQEVFSSFERDPAKVLSAPLISPGQLDSIESAYVAAGRYFDLLAMYRKVAQAEGLGSRAAARHTWGLIRLGQTKQARDRALALVRHDPESARAWFIYGASMLETARSDEDAAARVYVAWTRAVELDPAFVGIEGFRAEDLTREAAQARALAKSDDAGFAALRAEILGAAGAVPAPATAPAPGDAPAPAPGEATGDPTPASPAPDAPPSDPSAEVPSAEVPPADTPPPEDLATDALPAEAPPAEPPPEKEPLALGLMKARMAASGGDADRARAELGLARARHLSGDLDAAIAAASPRDALEYVRLEWMVGDKNRAARAWRALAKRAGMTPAQRYEVAMFGAREVEDLATSLELLRALEQDAPDYAGEVGVRKVIESLTP